MGLKLLIGVLVVAAVTVIVFAWLVIYDAGRDQGAHLLCVEIGGQMVADPDKGVVCDFPVVENLTHTPEPRNTDRLFVGESL